MSPRDKRRLARWKRWRDEILLPLVVLGVGVAVMGYAMAAMIQWGAS